MTSFDAVIMERGDDNKHYGIILRIFFFFFFSVFVFIHFGFYIVSIFMYINMMILYAYILSHVKSERPRVSRGFPNLAKHAKGFFSLVVNPSFSELA